MLQLRLEEKSNGKNGLNPWLIKKIKLPRSPTLESHMLLPFFNSIMHQLRSEERSNGKTGLNLWLTKKTKLPRLLIPESHTPPLSFNSRTHQLKSEERSNGKDGPNLWLIKRIKPPRSPTLEFHTLPPLSKLREDQKDSPTVWPKKRRRKTPPFTSNLPSILFQTTSNSSTSLTHKIKMKSLSKLRIETSHSTSNCEVP